MFLSALLSGVKLFVTPWTVSSSVHGIFQARVLECVAISSSRGSSQSRDWTCISFIAGRFFTCWNIREAPLAVSKVTYIFLFNHLVPWCNSSYLNAQHTLAHFHIVNWQLFHSNIVLSAVFQTSWKNSLIPTPPTHSYTLFFHFLCLWPRTCPKLSCVVATYVGIVSLTILICFRHFEVVTEWSHAGVCPRVSDRYLSTQTECIRNVSPKWSESEIAQSCPTLCDPMDSSLHQAPPSMGFSRQEDWSGLPFPSPGRRGFSPKVSVKPLIQQISFHENILFTQVHLILYCISPTVCLERIFFYGNIRASEQRELIDRQEE